MTNLKQQEEEHLKEYIEENNLGSANLDSGSVWVEPISSSAKDKIKEYADEIIWERLKREGAKLDERTKE